MKQCVCCDCPGLGTSPEKATSQDLMERHELVNSHPDVES